MSPPITKEHAEKIQRKLKAKVLTYRSAHDLAQFFHQGVLIVQFGLRRGSNKSLGHGHIPDDLHISQRQALDLARCPLSLDQYIDILKQKGFIQEQETEPEEDL
jgi:hypothetical protein